MHYVHGKQVAVIGLGRSGFAAARLLSVHGAHVVILDDKTPEKLSTWIEKSKDFPHVQLMLGGIDPATVLSSDLVVTSPGVPPAPSGVGSGTGEGNHGDRLEMELAFGYCPTSVAAITGTNGKTTTTTLLTAMINVGGRKAVACGNIGKAFAEAVFELSSEDWAVLEVSSFQLETIETFRPRVAAVLNVTPDHLDRHEGMQAYVETKGRIFENQQPEDAALLNVSDKYTPILSSLVKGQLYLFGFPGAKGTAKPGCFVAGNKIELLGRPLMEASGLKIPGPHNLENACAAALMASLCGVSDSAIVKTLSEFTGVEHRLEAAGEIDGIRFVNDSKGTNVDSVLKALESFERPIVLILGGRDKAGDFSRLAPLVKEKVTRIVAFGECKTKVVQQLASAATVVEAGTLEETVRGAYAASQKGGVVLFSPGCASFDMFQNYEDRGRQFQGGGPENGPPKGREERSERLD